jgi:hypothetical protein
MASLAGFAEAVNGAEEEGHVGQDEGDDPYDNDYDRDPVGYDWD